MSEYDPHRAIELTERVALALEAIAGLMAVKQHETNNVSLYSQLAGNASGFTSELDEILNSDQSQFDKSKALRDLLNKGKKITANYERLAAEAVKSEHDETQTQAGVGQEVRSGGEGSRGRQEGAGHSSRSGPEEVREEEDGGDGGEGPQTGSQTPEAVTFLRRMGILEE